MAKKKGKLKSAKASNSTKQLSITDSINTEVIAAALSTANQPVLVKMCRLCEAKDGPFLNIFDAEKVTAKKIEDLMPFAITENDDLPHKICFRCSAKVEELYEFVQKCVKTQNSLRIAIGKKEPVVTKVKTRTIWEEKLNKSNMSNEDICNALIKKAMEGIKDIPLKSLPLEEDDKSLVTLKKGKNNVTTPLVKKEEEAEKVVKEQKEDLESENNSKQPKLSIDRCDKGPQTRTSRSNNSESLLDGLEGTNRRSTPKQTPTSINMFQNDYFEPPPANAKNTSKIKDFKINEGMNSDGPENSIQKKNSDKIESTVVKEPTQKEKPEEIPPFDIMDHVTMIKVNGVGVLFQCKLCKRNFLRKEVVISHACAKNGVPKVDFTKNLPPPEPPKPPTIKYIKIDRDLRKPKNTDQPVNSANPVERNKVNIDNRIIAVEEEKETRTKPKAGPASRVKRNMDPVIGMTVHPKETPSIKPHVVTNINNMPIVNFPNLPSLNNRYKLVPGPNNTFTLVEEHIDSANQEAEPDLNSIPKLPEPKTSKKKKHSDEIKKSAENNRKQSSSSVEKSKSPEIIDLDDNSLPQTSKQQPYPVGLFQTVPHHSTMFVPPTPVTEPAPFTTPAMKKQSYTVVQTGNPSKLLISVKPQQPVEDVPKKRQRKTKHEVREDKSKQPFTVTLEDSAPPKDPGFFTFINVDPLLQPSYVLPTDNIIQESQISTSTPVAKSSSDLDESSVGARQRLFREKKALASVKLHCNKMDEEDQIKAEKNSRKRGRK